MAYPDYTTSHAPDFVGTILRIPGMYNEMQNNNARTALAQQQAATQRWMAEINARKAEQEIANEPREQDRKDALAQAEVNLRKEQLTEIPGKITAQGYNNMLNQIHLDQARKQQADQELATQMAGDLQKLQPYEYAGEEGQEVIKKYTPLFHDPFAPATIYKNFAVNRSRYADAVERNSWDEDTVAAWKDASDVQKLDDPQAMAIARDQHNLKLAKQAAAKQAEIERVKAEAYGQRPSLTAPEQKAVDAMLGKPPKFVKAGDLTQAQRAQIEAKLANEVLNARMEGRDIDEETIANAWKFTPDKKQATPYVNSLFK